MFKTRHSFMAGMVALLGPSLGWAQVAVDAGPDQIVVQSQPVTLQGAVPGRSPLDFWVADGNGATEDHLIKFNSQTGVTALGPLQDPNMNPGGIFGWPADLERVGNVIYGLDATNSPNRRRLYTLNGDTAEVTPVGVSTTYRRLTSLAYDPDHDLLYAADAKAGVLLTFDRTTGAATPVTPIFPYKFTWGLAYDQVSGLLYGCAKDTTVSTNPSFLYSINPADNKRTLVMLLPTDSTTLYDELTFFNGKLYALLSQGPYVSAQVQRIDPATGEIINIGPVIEDVSAHSLIINSVPEEAIWSVLAGPGVVSFTDPASLDSGVSFSEPGVYTLALTVFAAPSPIVDTVTIDLRPDCDGNGLSDWDEIDADPSLDCDLDDILDVCQPGADTDGDGVSDACDGCPSDPEKTVPGLCGCGILDTDSDADGVADCADGCPQDAGKTDPGSCGCGTPDGDVDGDGTADCLDACPDDPAKTEPGACGCGVLETDTDGDGTPDCLEGCSDDSECDDGSYCNGAETCDAVLGCLPGTMVNCDDGVDCTVDSCDDLLAGCVHAPDDTACDDGSFCNGAETCNEFLGCQPGGDPCGGIACDELLDRCGPFGPAFLLTFQNSTTVPGLGLVEPQDVVAYELTSGTWLFIFDGSDVGLAGFTIDGMTLLPTREIILSFAQGGVIPDLLGWPAGTPINASHFVLFAPSSLGSDTAGTLSVYLDLTAIGIDPAAKSGAIDHVE